jgi:aerobic carbon-monoxide dehydrogenase small subunit
MTLQTISFTLNSRPCQVTVDPTRTLLDVLRNVLGLTGSKEGCGQGDCGACVVLLNGRAVNACLVLAAQVDGCQVLTVEGLAVNGDLHLLQRKFAEKWAFQCGFCTPGMLMSAYALLLENQDPDEAEIRSAVAGNLCRCTSYQMVVEAVKETAQILNAPGQFLEDRNG